MNWRTTVALLAIVAVLSIFVFLFEKKQPSTAEIKKASKMVAPKFEDQRDKVSRIIIERPRAVVKETPDSKNGPDTAAIQHIELKMTGPEDWRITAPIAYPADRYRAQALISGLRFLEKREVDKDVFAITPKDKAKLNPADYKLDENSRIRIIYFAKEPGGEGKEENEKQVAEIYLSSEKLLGGDSVYAALPASMDKEIYVVGPSLYTEVVQTLDGLREHRTFGKLGYDTVVNAAIVRTGAKLGFRKQGIEWLVTEPVRDFARSKTVEDAIRAVVSVFTKEFVEDNPADLSRYGIDKPRFRITLTDKDGKANVLLIGKNVLPADPDAKPETFYAMLEGQPTVLSLPNDMLKEIEKPVNDFRTDKLLIIQPEKANRLVIERAGASAWDLRMAAGDWKFVEPAPYDADESAVSDLIADLKNIAIKDYMPNVLPPSAEQMAASGAVHVAVYFDEATNLQPVRALLVPMTDKDIQVWRELPQSSDAATSAFDPANAFLIDRTAYDVLSKPMLALRARDMFKFGKAAATRIEIVTPKGTHVAAKSGEMWKLESPTGTIDTGRLEDILWRTTNLRADELVAEIADDAELAKYGLADGAFNLKITAGDKSLDLLLGTEDAKGTLAVIRGTKLVFKVASGANGLRQLCADGLLKGAKLVETAPPAKPETPAAQPAETPAEDTTAPAQPDAANPPAPAPVTQPAPVEAPAPVEK